MQTSKFQFRFNSRLLLHIVLLSVILVLLFVFTSFQTKKASAGYDGSRIIDNSVFLNAASMSANDIQAFLVARGGGLANMSFLLNCYGPDSMERQLYTAAGAPCDQVIPASQIIYYAAQIYGVNPRVILATLQKEQSLVTAANPTSWQINQAMGYGCPTTGQCGGNSTFSYQIDSGTWVLRFHYERARGNMTWWHTSTSWTCGTQKNFYSPNLYPNQNVSFYDGNGTLYRTYFLQNAATSSFYCYTPHAYNNPQGLYGRAPYGTTGQYYSGSFNFVLFYELWFGSTHADAYAAQPVWQSVFTDSSKTTSLGWNATLRTGQSAYVVIQMRNTGNTTWTRQNGALSTMLGTTNTQDRTSGFCHPSWYHPCNRPVLMSENSVAPGQIGTFEFPISAPGATGVYNESFSVVANGAIGYFPSSATIQFTVEPERNTAQPVWQSVFTDSTKTTSLGWNATLRTGQTAYAVVQMRNTGNTTWTRTGTSFNTMLGTTSSQDRNSAFCSVWVFPCKRPALLSESSVAPGQVGTFEFPVTAPSTPGVYFETFGPVINGKGYMVGQNTIQFTVEPERNRAQPVWQSVFTDSSKTTSLGWNATLNRGQTAYVVVALRNTGNIAWTKNGGINDIMLGTVLPQDRTSTFCSSWLYPCNRTSRLQENIIQPGQIGTFEFAIQAPSQPGQFAESFGPVVNGKGYFQGFLTINFTVL